MRMKLVLALLISVACICGATNVVAKSEAANGGNYTTKDKEFYLTPELLLFIRPGLVIEILYYNTVVSHQVESHFVRRIEF